MLQIFLNAELKIDLPSNILTYHVSYVGQEKGSPISGSGVSMFYPIMCAGS